MTKLNKFLVAGHVPNRKKLILQQHFYIFLISKKIKQFRINVLKCITFILKIFQCRRMLFLDRQKLPCIDPFIYTVPVLFQNFFVICLQCGD